MKHEMPEHLPELPSGYVYAGRLEDYPSGKPMLGIVCPYGDEAWTDEVVWKGLGRFGRDGPWHHAVREDSDLGRKILAERGKPSWADAPDWAEWLAQDADGGWWFYSDCPESDAWRDEWQKICGSTQHVSSGPSNRHWRNTLERRPESTKAGKLHVEIDASEARRVVDEALEDAFEEIPDMIIPKDAAAQIEAYSFISDLARMGYRLEVDSGGIRGWKED